MLSSRPVQLNGDGPLPHHLNQFPTKTPKRATKGAKAENAIVQATVNGKAKSMMVNTPFHHKTVQPQRISKDGAGAGQKIVLATVARGSRPLGDKTPFPNRNVQQLQHTPLAQMQKLGSLFDGKGELQRRPSSARTNLRFRKSGGGFETPMNPGNPWEVDEGDVLLQPPEEVVHVEPRIEDDFDDIEYVPQITEVPYQPPFDFEMPDYKLLGKRLFDLAHSYPYDDTSPPVVDWDPSQESLGLVSWDAMLPSSDIDLSQDDPFRQALKPKNAQAKPTSKVPPVKPSLLKPQPTATSRTIATSKPSSTVRPDPVKPGPSTRTYGTSRLTVPKPRIPNITVTSTATTQNPGTKRTGRTDAVAMTTPAGIGRPLASKTRTATANLATRAPGNAPKSNSTIKPVPKPTPNVSIKPNFATTTALRPPSVVAKPRPTTSASYYRGPRPVSSKSTASSGAVRGTIRTGKSVSNTISIARENNDVDVVVLTAPPQVEDFLFDI
ncbi:hypothetical protein BDN72DRAFT_955868 [Pluteus cervinus]|uniref:Uncharacterized protein n=1 Tax=Pluteus cervinus TaxID=181527 RepID=A0ACD3B9C5_9AGAR|nr:hypothetical protein BDN72DRAFT_955868 [Pluteus cervinus]